MIIMLRAGDDVGGSIGQGLFFAQARWGPHEAWLLMLVCLWKLNCKAELQPPYTCLLTFLKDTRNTKKRAE